MHKALVACFSASGVTAALSERLASAIGADLFEIRPETPYTAADLDWMDEHSRSTVEMRDRAARPAIANRVENMAQYDTVFVGFPVWWYREPSIIDTFLEAYDFTGKTVVPFATSGGSELGETARNFQSLAKTAKVEAGRRFQRSTSEDELKRWASQWL